MSNLARGIFAGLLASVCIAGAASPSRALTQDEIANYSGADRQKVLEEGARKEGKFVYYVTLTIDAIVPVNQAFEAKYPFLKVEYINTPGPQIMQRAQAEQRARSVRVDVMAAGATDSLAGTGLLQPYSSPVLADFPPEYIDKNREWVANWVGYSGLAWNPKLVASNEVPTTWEGLADINPKFKGKIVWGASATAGGPRVVTHFRQMWGDAKAGEFLKKFALLDVRTSLADTSAMLQQVSVGEFAFSLGGSIPTAAKRKAEGASVDGKLLDPSILRLSTVGLLKGSPNPHAGVLFMDFLLSKEGQEILNKWYFPAANPKAVIPPELRIATARGSGVKELNLDGKVELEMAPKSLELFNTYFRGN